MNKVSFDAPAAGPLFGTALAVTGAGLVLLYLTRNKLAGSKNNNEEEALPKVFYCTIQ